MDVGIIIKLLRKLKSLSIVVYEEYIKMFYKDQILVKFRDVSYDYKN